jgi:hypothetical protein
LAVVLKVAGLGLAIIGGLGVLLTRWARGSWFFEANAQAVGNLAVRVHAHRQAGGQDERIKMRSSSTNAPHSKDSINKPLSTASASSQNADSAASSNVERQEAIAGSRFDALELPDSPPPRPQREYRVPQFEVENQNGQFLVWRVRVAVGRVIQICQVPEGALTRMTVPDADGYVKWLNSQQAEVPEKWKRMLPIRVLPNIESAVGGLKGLLALACRAARERLHARGGDVVVINIMFALKKGESFKITPEELHAAAFGSGQAHQIVNR